MNEMMTQRASLPPTDQSQAFATLVSRISGGLEEIGWKLQISSRKAPNEAERRSLQQRMHELEASLLKCPEAQIAKMVGTLRLAYGGGKASEAERKVQINLYIQALREFPEWAISKACGRFNMGLVGNPEFAPTPAALAAECQEIVSEVHKERFQLKRIFSAEVYSEVSPEERERVKQKFDALLGDLRAGLSPEVKRETPKTNPAEALAEMEAARDSFVVEESPELKAAIQRILSEP